MTMTFNKNNVALFKLNRRALASIMLERNLTLAKVADMSGLTRRTLYNGFGTGIMQETLIKIAKALDVPASSLVEGDFNCD